MLVDTKRAGHATILATMGVFRVALAEAERAARRASGE
jgi:hypothetical protein